MKTHRLIFFTIIIACLHIVGTFQAFAQDQSAGEAPLLMAHFMPWYQTPEISGYWGWHWTMENFDPELVDENGKPQIASHYMPLTGTYDSADDDILEYQTLLMKLSGIDGVIVDWYGIENYNDGQVLNESTVKLFDAIKKAGLKFIICYEDHTIKDMINGGHLNGDEAHAHAQEVMQYLQDTWFGDDAYVKYGDQPLLFVYGPQYFRTPQDWDSIFANLETIPLLVTLDKHMDWAAFSSYPWPPMDKAGGIEMPQVVWERHLNLFYRNAQGRDYIVGSAFPAFWDIYKEGGVRSSYGSINPQDGETLKLTLEFALQGNANLIQLVTWNDYGEGTIIEPTEEFGYQYLEIIQDTHQSLSPDAFNYSADDLHLPLRLFHLRRAYPDNADINIQLDEVYSALLAGDVESAATMLDELE